MQFFDTHIHLSDFENTTPHNLMQRLKNVGIEKCICVSSQPKDWEKTAEFAHTFPSHVIPAFGIHPWYADQFNTKSLQKLEKYLNQFPTAFIGECGFDRLKNPDFEMQRLVFENQLQLAIRRQRPMILHMVKADMWFNAYLGKLPHKSVFHSFSGPAEFLKKILKFDSYISVNAKFFRKKDALNILKQIPENKLLIETDAPFQSMPEDLPDTVHKIADIKALNLPEAAQKLYDNALNLISDDINLTY